MCTIADLFPLFAIYSRTIVKSKSFKNPLKELNTIILSLERTVCNHQAKQSILC